MKRIHGLVPTTLLTLVLTALVWWASLLGFWYVSIIVGVIAGTLLRSGSAATLVGILVGVGGWGLPLWWQSHSIPVRETAVMVAQIMGFGAYGVIVIALTLVLGLLYTLCGVWVARSIALVLQRNVSIPRVHGLHM